MSTVVVPQPVPREQILQHATRLRERILAGECPYPDAMMEANESFLAQLSEGRQADLHRADQRELLGMSLRIAGMASAAAVVVFGLTCAPLAASAVVAASGAIGARTLIALGTSVEASGRASRQFATQLEAWSRYNSDAAPRIAPWQGIMTVGGLKSMMYSFPAEVKEFPYAETILADQERLLKMLPPDDNRSMADVKTDFVARALRPKQQSARLLSTTGSLLLNASWIAGATALAYGHPGIAVGLFGGVLAGKGLGMLAEHLGGSPPDAARAARSLHFWEQWMAKAPPPTVEKVIFGSPPAPREAGTIERSQEDVRIGKVVVPVKKPSVRADKP